MHPAHFYRQQAERARRLASSTTGSLHDELRQMAQEFDDIAEDIEIGAVEVRHPEMLPQRRR
jgi:hypothetical protein